MRYCLILMSCLLIMQAQAATYYVANDGDDNTEGREESRPWRTLDKVNASSFQAGDVILFKRDSLFRGSLNTKTTQKLTFGAFGTGQHLPIISGSVPVTDWRPTVHPLLNKAVYEADISQLPLSDKGVYHLFLNGQLLTLARYPNVDSPKQVKWLKVAQTAGKNGFTDPVLANYGKPDGYWIGATLRIRIYSWTYVITPITDYQAATGKITAKGLLDQLPEWGYFLDNKLEELDHPGEWYYDAPTQKVYLYPPEGSDLNTALVEAMTHEVGLQINTGKHENLIENLAIRHFIDRGIGIVGSDNVIVRNCQLDHNGTGIYVWNGANTLVTGNILDFHFKGSIVLQSSRTFDVKNSVAEKNTITNTAMYPLYGDRSEASYQGVGINVAGMAYTVRQNTIENTCWNGIYLKDQGKHRIENNIVRRSLVLLNDGGAIAIGANGNTIRGNFLFNSIGNVDESNGCGSLTVSPCMKHSSYGMGIGADNNYKDNIIENNTVAYHPDKGIRLNAYVNTIVRNNVMFGNEEQLYIEDKKGPSQNNLVENNILYSLSPDHLGLILTNQTDHGPMDNNTYCNPYSKAVIERNGIPYSLKQWQATFPQYDKNSKTCPFSLPEYTISESGANLLTNATFDQDVSNWKGSGAATITWDAQQLDGGSLKMTYKKGQKSASVIPNNFSLTQGQYYRLKFSLLGAGYGNIRLRISDSDTSQFNVLIERNFVYDTTRQEHEMVFQASQTLQAKLLLLTQERDAGYWLDNVHLEPVTAVLSPPNLRSVLFTNMTENSQDIDLAGKEYWDLAGETVKGTLTVAPFSSQILVATTSPPPAITAPVQGTNGELIDNTLYSLQQTGEFTYFAADTWQTLGFSEFQNLGYQLPTGGFSSPVTGLLLMQQGDRLFPANTLIATEANGKAYWWLPGTTTPGSIDFTPVNAVFSIPTGDREAIYYAKANTIFSVEDPNFQLPLSALHFPSDDLVKIIARDPQGQYYYVVTQSNQTYVFNTHNGHWLHHP